MRTAGNILEEIKLRLNQYEVAQFVVCDPAVNQDLGMLSDLCDMIIDEGLDIKWDGMAQISNDMGLDLLKKMERAGCVMLNYGVESGSEKVLKSMGKKYTPDEAEDVIKNTSAAGINVVMNMIVGYPNESEQDFNMTLEFVERVRPYVFNIAPGHPCLVVPYNRLFTHPGKYGIIFDEDSPSLWQTANGSNDEILREERAGIFDRFLDDLDIPIRCGDDDRELLEKDRKDGND